MLILKFNYKLVLNFIFLSFLFIHTLKADDDISKYIDQEYIAAIPEFSASYTNMELINKHNNSPQALKQFNTLKPSKILTTHSSLDQEAIEIALYEPQNSNNKSQDKYPVILFSYAGGFLFRDLYYFSERYQHLANTTQAMVVVPRYRLIQEKAFPAPIYDNYSAWQYIVQHAQELKIDSNNLILMGESAGGGLSAALALYNRDHDNLPVKSQILIYPMLDYQTGSIKKNYTLPEYRGKIGWDQKSNVFAWEKYANGKLEYIKNNSKCQSNDMLGYFSPSHACNFKKLPPSFIYIGDADLFLLESIEYAQKLIQNGNQVELHVIPGLYHLFDITSPNAQASKNYRQALLRFIKHHISS